ncbi:MAG: ATP-binding protein [Granulosicoccus sp.]
MGDFPVSPPVQTSNPRHFPVISALTDNFNPTQSGHRLYGKPALLIPLIGVVAITFVALGAMQLTENRLRRDAAIDLLSESKLISNSVDRLRHLPVAVAHHPHIIASLASSAAPGSVEQTQLDRLSNAYLQTVSEAAGTSLLYIIDSQGRTRAANNWQSKDSLVGNRYQFRLYFQHAMLGKEVRYYAVGVTTGEAGYYFAQPVRKDDVIVGVAVAKLELESLQQQWQEKKPHSLLIDEEGVTILSSNPAWRYRTTRELSQQQLDTFESQRKYANQTLQALNTSAELTRPRLHIDGQQFLSSTANLPLQNWRLVQLTPKAPVYNAGIVAALVTGLLAGLSTALFLYRRERQRKNILSMEAQDAARMRSLNQELQAQISERRKAEKHLKEAQTELIQASKLAALGQMSAAIAHEVNQPLSAIRTFSASAKLLLDRDRLTEAHQNLDEIHALTERLAILTYDLKTFARKSDVPRETISLQACINRVKVTLDSDLDERQIRLVVSVPEQAVCVLGNAIRIEQVLSNLIRNAMDATSEVAEKGIVNLSVGREEHEAVIHVQDNGKGMSDADISHVFEPFFTTKPMGEGVGLGLSIAYGIIEEMGGQLRVRNSNEGGALFSVRLPYHKEARG